MPQDKNQNGTKADPHPGMMGDGTEEQNLNQKGDPKARISEDEVKEAFAEKAKTEKPASQ